MNNEETIYDNERTAPSGPTSTPASDAATAPTAGRSATWRRAGMGMGVGILLGSTTSFIVPDRDPAAETADAAGEETPADATTDDTATTAQPIWAGPGVEVATGVTDDMSFSEAFAVARAEVGAGGAFEWRGNAYSTYLAEEWDAMSAAERNDYHQHFAWSQQHGETETGHNDDMASADVEVVTVEEPAAAHATATAAGHDPEIEVLGVVHDTDTGANIGGVVVDGQEIMLIDVDGDMVADVLVADLNHDGQISPDEAFDISGQQLSLTDLIDAADGDDALASDGGDGPDYIGGDGSFV